MSDTEGVIKFRLAFTAANPPPAAQTQVLNGWRRILYLTGLIGQDPKRYGGYGFGNVSCRVPPYEVSPGQRSFIISGTQTGGLPCLEPTHYVRVRECHWERNEVLAEGPVKPSSEALTHGAVYALDAEIRCVFHVHSPALWHNAQVLGIPMTRPEVAYGTPAMAQEVESLFAGKDEREPRLFAMGGHEDGVVSFGRTAEEAGCVLLSTLVRAWGVERVPL